MPGLKEQLDAAGYDVSNLNEADLIKKLDQAGYDTASIAPSQNNPSPSPDNLSGNVVKDVISNAPKILAQSAWEGLQVPEKVANYVLPKLTNLQSNIQNTIAQKTGLPIQEEPTGNLARDVVANIPRIAGETASQVYPGMVDRNSLLLAAATGGASKLAGTEMAQKAGNAVLNAAASGVEKTVGIESAKVINLFKKPLSMFTAPTKSAVDVAYSGSELAQAEKTLKDIVEEGTTAYAGKVKRAGKALLNGEENAATYLQGRKALDKQIAVLESQIATAKTGKSALQDAINSKYTLRDQFNQVLDVLAPNHRIADKMAADQLNAAPFRQLMLPGKMSFMSPEGIARVIPGLPSAVGAGVSLAGGLAKGASPAMTATMAAALESLSKNRKR